MSTTLGTQASRGATTTAIIYFPPITGLRGCLVSMPCTLNPACSEQEGNPLVSLCVLWYRTGQIRISAHETGPISQGHPGPTPSCSTRASCDRSLFLFFSFFFFCLSPVSPRCALPSESHPAPHSTDTAAQCNTGEEAKPFQPRTSPRLNSSFSFPKVWLHKANVDRVNQQG